MSTEKMVEILEYFGKDDYPIDQAKNDFEEWLLSEENHAYLFQVYLKKEVL
jgi:hypothetical protein